MEFLRKFGRPAFILGSILGVIVLAGIVRALVLNYIQQPTEFTGELVFERPSNFSYDVSKVAINRDGAKLLRPGTSGAIVLLDDLSIPENTDVIGFFDDATVGEGARVGYQLTSDYKTWYYHDGSRWTDASGCGTCTNTVDEVNEHIGDFNVSSGKLKLRVVLLSEGKGVPTLRSASLVFSGDPEVVSIENQGIDELFKVAAVGPVEEGCAKIEGSDIGEDGIEIELESCTVTINSWDPKEGEENEFVGFDYTSDCDGLSFEVKSSTNTESVDPASSSGSFGPTADNKGISNITFCEEEEAPEPEVIVSGQCVETDAEFTISNIGEGDMASSAEYRVYRNDVLETTDTYQLDAGESVEVTVASNGDEIKIEVDFDGNTLVETLTCEEEVSPEVEVSGVCSETDAVFTIENTGDGDMEAASEYRVYRNDVLEDTQSYQLDAGETLEVTVDSTGDEIKIEVDFAGLTLVDTLTCEEEGEPDIELSSQCTEDDAAEFTITNVGAGDMEAASEYRVYRNDVLEDTQSYQLTSGEELVVTVASGGDEIRFEVDFDGATLTETLTCGEEEKILICHATPAEQNPFVVLEVPLSAVDGEGANDHTLHEGDIIPITDLNGDNEIDEEDCVFEEGEPDIEVFGQCTETDAEFTIANIGDAMESASEYRVYRNDVLEDTQSFQLGAGEEIDVVVASNGDEIRLEADFEGSTLVETLTCAGEEEEPAIELTGVCSEEAATFTIFNTGEGDMVSPEEYRVFRNGVEEDVQSYQLEAGEILNVVIDSDGDEIELEVDDPNGGVLVETLSCFGPPTELSVAGICVDDSDASFVISNTGEAMDGPSEYRILRELVLEDTDTFQLGANDQTLPIVVTAGGDAITIEVDDPEFGVTLTETIEDCGGVTPSSLVVDGECVAPNGVFTITSSGGPGTYQVFRDGLLDDTQTFTSAPFTPLTFNVNASGDTLLVQAELEDETASDEFELADCGTPPTPETPETPVVVPEAVPPTVPAPVVVPNVSLVCPTGPVTASSFTIPGTIDDLPTTIQVQYSTTGGSSWLPAPPGSVSGLGSDTITVAIPNTTLESGDNSLAIRAVLGDGTILTSATCDFTVGLGLIFGHNEFVLPAQASAITNAGIVSFFVDEPQKFYLEAPGATDVTCTNLGTQEQFILEENQPLHLWEGDLIFRQPGVWRMQCTASNPTGSYARQINQVFVSDPASIVDNQTGQAIENSLMTTYRQDPDRGTFDVFDASALGRENPEEIGPNFFSYLPEGVYYFELASPGYTTIRSRIFEIQENSIVTANVRMASADSFVQQVLQTLSLGPTDNFPVNVTPLEPEPLNELGAPAPNFTMTDEEGNVSSLRDQFVPGKPTVLYAFSDWNTLSAEQQEMYTQVKDLLENEVTFVAISTFEPTGRVGTQLERGDYLIDSFVPDPEYFDKYYANSLPQFYLINEQGNLVDVINAPQSSVPLTNTLQEKLIQQ